jgi:hypothetical protein
MALLFYAYAAEIPFGNFYNKHIIRDVNQKVHHKMNDFEQKKRSKKLLFPASNEWIVSGRWRRAPLYPTFSLPLLFECGS